MKRPTLTDCSVQVLTKADAMVRADAVTHRESRELNYALRSEYTVLGSRGDEYTVIITHDEEGPRWASCSCPHGSNTSRYEDVGCSHIAAVLMYREVMPDSRS